MNRRFVRSVRRAAPDRPGAQRVNRSATDGCSSTPGTASRPSPVADNESVSPTPAQQARASAIAAEIAALATAGFALPGTLADRMTRCGRPNCGCHADPPRLHGPYHQWTRKKDGKTATRILSDDQLADYQPWFDNHRRLRQLITELEALSLEIADADPRWNR
jgi:hypothetical protein